jgi:hypothetical protein
MSDTSPPPSFTPHRKWSVAFQVGLLSFLVLAVMVMVNYLSRDFFFRWHASNRTKVQLSSRTLNLLKTITNQVKVIVYYDKRHDPLYSTIIDLLNEYHQANSLLTLQVVDYLNNSGLAQKVMADYRDRLAVGNEKNLVIFDCEGRVKVLDGDALAHYSVEQIPNEKEPKFRAKPLAFLGELAFTSALLEVVNPKPLNAYFLEGHQEHAMESGDAVNGSLRLDSVVKQNCVNTHPLSLVGPGPVPADCSLLIIAGPRQPLAQVELDKIDQYLAQGGRLLALFNSRSVNRPTGLENILAKWGVGVGANIVVDPDHSPSGSEVIVSSFTNHRLVNPLLKTGLYLIQPRTVCKLPTQLPAPDALRVEEIAFTFPGAFLLGNESHRQRFPLMVAVEKPPIKGVITERGTTRMVVVGDSLFLGNNQIDLLGNRDFAGYAVNWLLDRAQLLEGVGPQRIDEYRLVMTPAQLQRARWLLLGGLPGTALLLGGLVWLRRRR